MNTQRLTTHYNQFRLKTVPLKQHSRDSQYLFTDNIFVYSNDAHFVPENIQTVISYYFKWHPYTTLFSFAYELGDPMT